MVEALKLSPGVGSAGRLAGAVVEQAAMGLVTLPFTAAVTSIAGARGVGSFALAWSVAWGAFAVLSEALLTPTRVALVRGRVADREVVPLLGLALRVVAVCAVLSGALLWFGDPLRLGTAAGVAGVTAAGVCLHSSRLLLTHAGRRTASLVLASSACVLACLAALIISLSTITWPWVLVVAMVVVTLPAAGAFPHAVSRGGGGHFARQSLSRNWLFGLGTLLRVLAYSTGILALVIATGGPETGAVFAAAFLVIAPVQLAGGTLPWVLLPRLAAATERGNAALRREAALQFLAYTGVGISTAAALLTAWGPWTRVLVHDDPLRSELGDVRGLVGLLLVVVLLSSWAGLLWQCTGRSGAQVLAVVAAGCTGLAAVVLGVPVVLAAATPYAVFIALGVCWSVVSLRGGAPDPTPRSVRIEHSTEGGVGRDSSTV